MRTASKTQIKPSKTRNILTVLNIDVPIKRLLGTKSALQSVKWLDSAFCGFNNTSLLVTQHGTLHTVLSIHSSPDPVSILKLHN